MNKHKKLIKLIDRIEKKIQFNLIEIVDYWDSDLCAIGLKKENCLIYISMYNYIEEQDLRYDFDIEDTLTNQVIKKYRGELEPKLIYEIDRFLLMTHT